MMRFLYICVLWMHPRRFSAQFGDEMLSIFDEARQTRSTFGLFADALLSVLRQWVLRPEFHHAPALASATGAPGDGVPMFRLCEEGLPRPTALINGAIVSIVVFATVVFAINRGGNHSLFLIGSFHAHHSHLLTVHAEAEVSELNTVITTTPDAAIRDHDPVRPFIVGYFRSMPILYGLDRNHDLVLTAEEMADAPALLMSLDVDGDGKLTAEECEARYKTQAKGVLFTPHSRMEFMRVHPVLAALDANHDGEISTAEMENAATALLTLDRNYDRKLTPAEVLPDPIAFQVFLFFQLDTDGDGKISVAERDNGFAVSFKSLFEHADRDRDGLVTEKELANEVRRRADLDGNGSVDWEEMLTAIRSGELARVDPRR